METTSLCSIALLSHSPSCNLFSPKNASFFPHKQLSATPTIHSRSCCIYASKKDSYGQHYDGKLVDENMILLRMRIREIEMVEMKMKAPSDWTEWEKNYSVDYVSDVCEAIGMLQRLLMNTKPSLALGMMALLMLSMSMSMSQLVFHVVEFTKGII
ncbi:hypothetical protein Lal_00046918 [Lupinus albus]|uniref:Uncharacterized protein n=1 Tax=Lupinus albus TaxID=3870 RepID=A0A6A4R052_LUPAL|nr:hypothetical protein Lalb_Chr02g0145501 [Lupinus albus]KAF1878252.1 hypothetical protein Lal_00046918 [Lupinus albus]